MRVEWVVAVAGASLLTGWLVGYVRVRRQRNAQVEEINRYELSVARLRGELAASVSHTTQARAEAQAAQAAVSAALLERGRLQERLEEHRASSVRAADHQAALDSQQELRAEVELLRRELAALTPLVDELGHYREYVETLQRELVYRDEQLLALQDRHRPLQPTRLSRPSGPPSRPLAVAAPEPQPEDHRPVEAPEPVIDLTDAATVTDLTDLTDLTDRANGAAPSAGQWRHDLVEQPAVEEVVQRAAGNV